MEEDYTNRILNITNHFLIIYLVVNYFYCSTENSQNILIIIYIIRNLLEIKRFSSRGREVKAADLKSPRIFPRRFESYRLR